MTVACHRRLGVEFSTVGVKRVSDWGALFGIGDAQPVIPVLQMRELRLLGFGSSSRF